MENHHESEGFYPYREQQQNGKDPEIPVVASLEEHHSAHKPKPKKRPSILVIAILIILAFGLFVFFYNRKARERQQANLALTPTITITPTPTSTPTPTPPQRTPRFPDPQLQSAYDNTVNANSMRAGFISDVRTRIVHTDSNEESFIDSRAEGYLTGAADGSTIQTELRITQTNDPSRSGFFGQILVNNRLFMKTNDKDWEERDRSDYNKLYENQPIDATAYAYNLLDTLFTQSKAVLRGIDEATVKAEADDTIDGKAVKVYSFSLSVPEYLNALNRDANVPQFTRDDAKKILQNANLLGRAYVDPATNYIVRLQISGANLTQISTEQSSELGIVTTHDMGMIANLLDFNQPVTLQPPK